MARYRRIDPYIWHDDKFPSFSDDAKLLFFHLLTTPRGNPLGCFVQGKADMAEYLGWSSKRLETPFRVLVSSDRIRYDEKTRLILIPRYLFYNPLENENQAKMACKYLSELPYNAQHFQGLKQSLEQYGKPFLILLVNALSDRINSGNGIGNGIGNGTPNTEPYPFLSEPQHLTVPPISPKGDEGVFMSFEEFYDYYPRKAARGRAEKAWKALKPDTALQEIISDALWKAKQSQAWLTNKQYIPYPATWLRDKGWLNEVLL